MTEQKVSGPASDANDLGTTPPANRMRRRLGKAALATPVLASLAARPAMACSISGFLSGNTSPGRTPPSCGGYGCTPGFWKNNPQVWTKSGLYGYNAGGCSNDSSFSTCNATWMIGGTKLGDILPADCYNDAVLAFSSVATPDKYMLEVFLDGLRGGNVTSNYAFVCHYMAAILNAATGSASYGSTVEEVKSGLCKAIELGKTEEYKNILAGLNERGCMFDAHGNCADGFVSGGDPLTCIPACKNGYIYDQVAKACVPIS